MTHAVLALWSATLLLYGLTLGTAPLVRQQPRPTYAQQVKALHDAQEAELEALAEWNELACYAEPRPDCPATVLYGD